MEVSIYSRKAVKELIENGFPQNAAVISFYTPKTIGKVQLYFGLFEENGLSEIRIKNDGSKHYQFQKEG